MIEALNEFPLACIHLMNSVFPWDNFLNYPENTIETFGLKSKHLVIANVGLNKGGEVELEKGIAKIIAYFMLLLANPDLPERFELDAELNQPDQATMYGGD